VKWDPSNKSVPFVRPIAEEISMKITIGLVTLVAKEVFVEFSTSVGFAAAIWRAAPPKVGDQYDVELEVEDEFVWGDNASFSLSSAHSIEVVDDVVTMTGALISNDLEGGAVVDVGGSIILIELTGGTVIDSVFVDLKVKSMSIFPTGI
jgi:hypothetical protein